MSFDITQILLAVLTLLGAVVTGVVVPWIKGKTTAAQQESIRFWTRMAVTAAEQIFGSGKGLEKKQYVVAWLGERGIYFDGDALDAAIEAAVYELKR